VRWPEGLPPDLIPVSAKKVTWLPARVEQVIPFDCEIVKGFVANVNFGVQERRGVASSHNPVSAFRAAASALSSGIKLSETHPF
jgi:hypothetical protein